MRESGNMTCRLMFTMTRDESHGSETIGEYGIGLIANWIRGKKITKWE